MVHDKNLRSCNLWPIKKLDRSIGLLDLDFIFLFRVIDFKSGDKNDGSDGTPFQSDGKTFSACKITFA